MTEGPQLDPLPAEALDMLRQVGTSTVATQLYKRGFRQPQLLGVRPLSQVSDGFVAEEFTMRFVLSLEHERIEAFAGKKIHSGEYKASLAGENDG